MPRDRRHQGLILPFSTADNINLASLPETATFGWEHRGKALDKARGWIEQLAIRPGRPELPVRFMSGGNQQRRFSPAGWAPMRGFSFSMNPPSGWISARAAYLSAYPRAGGSRSRRAGLIQRRAGAVGPLRPHLVMWRGELVANLPTRGLTLDALLVTINGGQEQQV